MNKFIFLIVFLLLVSLATAINVGFNIGKIEKDLTSRTYLGLKKTGLDNIVVKFDGRDATLVGKASSDKMILLNKFVNEINYARKVSNDVQEIDLEPKIVEKVEVVEKIVEKAEVVEKIVEKIEVVEKIVEKIKFVDRIVKVKSEDIYSEPIVAFFGHNSDRVENVNELNKKLAPLLEDSESVRYNLVGHADITGTDDYNLFLGGRRSLRIMSILVKNGIKVGQISSISHGSRKIASKGNSENNHKRNRRVEIIKITTQD